MKPLDRALSQQLLTLLRVALVEEPTNIDHTLFDETTNWNEVCRYASNQGVLAIAWDGLNILINKGIIPQTAQPTREIRLRWALSVERLEKRYAKQLKAIGLLAAIYGDEGITMTILKGYGLSLCYPTPHHRSCSDVDIWLGGEQQRADSILRNKHNIAIDEGEHHHTVFYIDGVMVENHYDFINIHAHRSSRIIEQHLKAQATQSNYEIQVEHSVVHLPNANLHALFLLRHAAAHFAGAEIVLRHVIDWAMFIKHYHKDIDWEWLHRVCHEQGMDHFADAMSTLSLIRI